MATIAESIVNIQEDYFQLAFERKPEFMGWSQTEPTTGIFNTAYKALSHGDEMQQRLDAYGSTVQKVEALEKQLPENLKKCLYPIDRLSGQGLANMNKKFLYRDKALIYAGQGRKVPQNIKKWLTKLMTKL